MTTRQTPTTSQRPPRRRLVKLVDPSYQPTKAEKEEEWEVPDMTLEEAARPVLAPVEVVTLRRPRRSHHERPLHESRSNHHRDLPDRVDGSSRHADCDGDRGIGMWHKEQPLLCRPQPGHLVQTPVGSGRPRTA